MKNEQESNHKRTCRVIALMFLGLITLGLLSLGSAAIAISESKKTEVNIARRQLRNEEEQMDKVADAMSDAIKDSVKESIKNKYR